MYERPFGYSRYEYTDIGAFGGRGTVVETTYTGHCAHWAIIIPLSLPAALWLLAKRRAARSLKRRGFAVAQVSTTASAD